MIRSELHFCIVYLDIGPIFHGMTHETFEEDIDLKSIEFAYVIQQHHSHFLVDLVAQKSVCYNYFSWERFYIDSAMALWVFGDCLKGRHSIDVDGFVDGILKIFSSLFLPAWLDWVFEDWDDVLSYIFAELGFLFVFVNLNSIGNTSLGP